MSTVSDGRKESKFKPLSRWFPFLILPLMLIVRFIPDWWTDGPSLTWAIGAFGPILLSMVLVVWWLGFSRARAAERLLGLLGLVIILVLHQVLAHETMRGPVFIVMTLPMTIAAFSVALIIFAQLLTARRTGIALVVAALVAGFPLMMRSPGVRSDFAFELMPRWSKASDQLVTELKRESEQPIPAGVSLISSWPNFRGPAQDGVFRGGPALDADWTSNPPKELWRITVGPAWSSFVAADKYLFTQEQRGDEEAVVCYDGLSGQQVWEAKWPSRFFEGLGGLGPRSTPALANDHVYALGAAGILVKLNARNGTQVWQTNVKTTSERAEPPMWGFSASPLVVNDFVIVHAGGKGDKGILAFQSVDGKLAWSSPAGEQSYGSVQQVNVLGKPLLALLSEKGAEFWDLSGKSVLVHEWPHQGYRALQPQILDGDKLIIPTGMGTGTRLVQLSEENGQLQSKEIWTSRHLKPDFNDVVVHKGHLYGFDNRIFTCIDLADGKRKWKGGHYEKGQAILNADCDLIMVVSEKGALALLKANPDKHEELAKISALEGKTWNHPVMVGNRLYLRNANEAVAYELPVKP